MKDVVADFRPFDDPVPPEVHDLDLVTFLFFYHDTTYMPVDRAEMDRKLFAALKPGGLLLIADHSALPGQGTSVGKTLHRIEESTLRKEVEAAGFHLVAENQRSVGREAELELRVGENDAALAGMLGAALIDGDRDVADAFGEDGQFRPSARPDRVEFVPEPVHPAAGDPRPAA